MTPYNREAQKRYNQSPRGKAIRRKYSQSPKRKAYLREYEQRPTRKEQVKPYRKLYKQIVMRYQNKYIGIAICPKCKKQGYAEKLTQLNLSTQTISFSSFMIKHYIGKKGRIPKYSHCLIYDENEFFKLNPQYQTE